MPITPTKVVFLIDEQSIMKQTLSLENLKLVIMRILLSYRSQQDQVEILWGYRFFSTQARYATDTIRQFYDLCADSFDAIEAEYSRRDSTRPQATTLGTPLMRVKNVLKEALGDFQWENTDMGTSVKHHVYVVTNCPSNIREMNLFFVSPVDTEDAPTVVPLFTYAPYFQQAKSELTANLSQNYNQRHICISLIDVDHKHQQCNPNEQKVLKVIRQGFESIFQQFGGHFISFQSLVKNYNIYGHSFVSEFANLLTKRVEEQVPAWMGPFKTKLGKSIGNFVLFPCLQNGSYQSSTLAFISEIRTITVIHASQFSTSWIQNEGGVEPTSDYKLTCEQGESPHLLNTVLDELFATQSLLIAELIAMPGYEQFSRKVSIEPFSRSCASLRFLNIQHMPITVRLKQVVVDEDYPVGNFITGTDLQVELPSEICTAADQPFKLDLYDNGFIKKLLQSKETSKKGKRSVRSSQQQKKEEKKMGKAIQLPADVNIMGKALKELYLELLYTQNSTVENALAAIDRWITHLLKENYTKQDIISTLFDYTMPYEDLDQKHRNAIMEAANKKLNKQSTSEQAYLHDWWQQVKVRGASDAQFENMSCTVLKLKEARLQVILYCFIARLTSKSSPSTFKRDPLQLAEQFFKKTVLTFTLSSVNEFLTELDAEDGLEAAKRRDPADLNDYVFMQLLEKCFKDLPDLTLKFREIVGMDEMASSPTSSGSNEDIDDMEDIEEPPPPQPVSLPPPSTLAQKQHKPKYIQKTLSQTFERPLPRRIQSDSTIQKNDKSIQQRGASKLAKAIKPQKMQRTGSSSKLDIFLKREMHMSSNKTAESRLVSRSKRAASTMLTTNKGEQSPSKRQKRTASRVTNQEETGIVILRREPIANPQTTPRTSLNRFLGADLFSDYRDPCLSPSSRTTQSQPVEARHYSEYPAPKTPQSTPNRYRKVMMNHTPHRTDDMDAEFSIRKSDERDKQPPYTPRTAARRERDRIDRSHPGINLTAKFQNMLQEERQQKKPIIKSGFSLFDDDDDEEEEGGENMKNENINPFLSGSTSRPPLRKTKTFDDLFNPSSEIPRLQFDDFHHNREEEEESDEQLDVLFDDNRQSLF